MDYIVIAAVVVIIGLAVGYIVKAKKSGAKCIGCSAGDCHCSDSKSASCCCCNNSEQSEK